MISDILAQTYTDWELIVVSNGEGQDAQLEVAEAYAAKDSRIKIIKSEQGGVSHARNLGIEAASADWVTFVDADDRLSPDHLQRYIEALRPAPSCDIVVGGYTLVSGARTEKIEMATSANPEEGKQRLVLENVNYVVWNSLFRRTAIGENRFDESLSMGEDAVFVMDVLLGASNVTIIGLTGYCYSRNGSDHAIFRYHDEQVMERLAAMMRQRVEFLLRAMPISADEVRLRMAKESVLRSAVFIENAFLPGSPFSLLGKARLMKERMFEDEAFKEAMKNPKKFPVSTWTVLSYRMRLPLLAAAFLWAIMFARRVWWRVKGLMAVAN